MSVGRTVRPTDLRKNRLVWCWAMSSSRTGYFSHPEPSRLETVLKVGGVTIIFDFCQNSTIPKAYAMNDEDRNAALDAIISTHALRPTANDRRSG